MILEALREKPLDHRSYKFVIEICMDTCGLVEEVSKRKLGAVYAYSGNSNPQGFKDVSNSIILNRLGLKNCSIETIPLLGYFAFLQNVFGISKTQLNALRKAFIEYVSQNNEESMLTNYAKTSMMRERIALQLSKRPEFDSQSVSDCCDEIVDLFRKNVAHDSIERNFMISSQSALAYLTNHYNQHFVKNVNRQIFTILSAKDFRMTLGDDKDIGDYSNYVPKEVKFSTLLTSFKSLAFDILKASSLIYKHGKDTYYDLWSRYKYLIAQSRHQIMMAKLNKRFPTIRASQCIALIDDNFKHYVNEKYRKGLYNCREEVLSFLWAGLEGNISPAQYEDCFNNMLHADLQFPDKNGRRLFGHDGNPPLKIADQELFIIILKGMIAVKKLASYCEKEGINPLTVPSDIFTSKELYVRINSFNEYMYIWKVTTHEMNENKDKELIPGIPTNDEVAKDMLDNKSRAEYKLQTLANLRFQTLKDIIDHMDSEEEQITAVNAILHVKSQSFTNAVNFMQKKLSQASSCYKGLLNYIPKLELSLAKQLGSDFSLSSYRMTTTGLRLPVMWRKQPSTVLKALDKINFEAFAPDFFKYVKGKPGCFYSTYRFINLNFVLAYHITHMLSDLNKRETSMISLFSVFEKYSDVINLPIVLTTRDEVVKLLENKMSDVKGNSDLQDLLNVSLCQIPGESILATFDNFKVIYNFLMRVYYGQCIKKVRTIRDAVYKELHLGDACKVSPFGKYHSRVMGMSEELDTGVIEPTATRNKTFMMYLANCDSTKHNFLVYHGRAVFFKEGGQKYFVHKTGKLYCPELINSPLMFITLGEDFKLSHI